MTNTLQAAPISPRLRGIAIFLLAALLILLAARLTSAESLRETLSQRQARLATAAAHPSDISLSGGISVGPLHIVFESAMLMLIAAAAAAIAGVSAGLPRIRAGQFLLIVAILACALRSTLQADNRFNALIGLADIAMALMAGWTTGVLCDLLGDQGRRFAIAALVAILTLWVCKGLLQYFVEFPDTIAMFRESHDEILRSQGIINDPVQAKLFESRVNSAEVAGYIALSNVFANGLIGLLAIATGVMVCGIRIPFSVVVEPVAQRRGMPHHAANKQDPAISMKTFGLFFVFATLITGIVLLPLTGSKGGTALGFIIVLIVLFTGIFWRRVMAWRRALVILTLIATVGGAALILSYGKHYDALPSKSLLFRWHYWTAAKSMIAQSPRWGVGLNNFGDFYMQFKRPSSPEDVKDPHNFFIRLAAEMGMPAAALVAVLVGWGLRNAYRYAVARASDVTHVPPKTIGPATIVAVVLATLVWAAIHLLFFTEPIEFNLYMTLIFGIAAAGIFMAVAAILSRESPHFPGMRYLCFIAMLGSGAMLAYDQINMALVTGPVAMLFWTLLGLGASLATQSASRTSVLIVRISALLCTTTCIGAALVLFLGVWLPLRSGKMPWDPAPFEQQYLQKFAAGDLPGARTALENAIQRAPNSIELLMQHIALLRDALHEPVAPEIRKVLSLDRANARIRVQLALIDSDLPSAERAEILDRALDLNLQLPEDELKRLPPELIPKIDMKIGELQASGR